mgnify:CR=1 FL=1
MGVGTPEDRRRLTLWQVALDAAALWAFACLSGGVASPVVFGLLLPVCCAAVLLPLRAAHLFCAVLLTVLGLTALAELSGRLPHLSILYQGRELTPLPHPLPLAANLGIFGAVALLCLVASPLQGGMALPPNAGVWAAIVFLALVATALAFLAQTWAQTYMSAPRAAIVLTLEPVFAGIFGVTVGGDTLTGRILAGGLCIVAAMTDPKAEPRYTGMSLIVVEHGTPGYQKVRKLDKLGMLSQDTAELFFEDCRVPKENLLGPEEGQGFIQLMQKLQQERLVIAIGAVASMWAVLDWTKQYCQERSAFGKPIIKFQNTRFKLVEMYTMAEICQTFLDRLLVEHMKGTDVVTETSMAKYFFTEESKKIVDQCLQFFGGYGYMNEYPISRVFRDVRVTTIFAGSTEIMKEIIGRNLGM